MTCARIHRPELHENTEWNSGLLDRGRPARTNPPEKLFFLEKAEKSRLAIIWVRTIVQENLISALYKALTNVFERNLLASNIKYWNLGN